MDKLMTYILLGLVVTTVYTAVQIVGAPADEEDASEIRSTEIQARELAVSGVEFAVRKIAEEPNWAQDELPEQVTLPGVLIEATPTAWHDFVNEDASDENACFVVVRSSVEDASARAEAIIERPGTWETPNALRYALHTGKNLQLGSGIIVRDLAGQRWNANVHTNGNLIITDATLVQGFGTYSSTLDDSRVAAHGVFLPNVNRGGVGAYRHPPIDPPAIDMARWDNLATRTYASSTTLAGDLNIGDAEDPGFWLIKGHCNLKANVRGTGVIFVEGDLRLYGSEARTVAREADEHLCIIVAGNVFAEDAKHTANIVCSGSFYGRGKVFLYGSLAAQGEINSGGTLDMFYRPLPTRLAAQVWGKQPQPPRIAMYFE